MEAQIFDVVVSHAKYCVTCDTITNATNHCARCNGPLIPLSKWFQPLPVEPVKVEPGYVIRIGKMDEEDGKPAYSLGEVMVNKQVFTDPNVAFTTLLEAVGSNGDMDELEGTMYHRIAGVSRVWQGENRVYCLVENKS